MLILSRRRRGRFSEADRYLRQVIGDANLIGWYDTRFPWTIDATAVGSWSDARGSSGYGPALAQATAGAKPTFDPAAQTITFDGTDDYLKVASAVFNTITAAAAFVYVGTLPTTGGSAEQILSARDSGGLNVLALNRNSSNGTAAILADTDFVPTTTVTSASGCRVLHGRRTASSGGNITVGIQLGSGAEGTTSGAAADQTWNSLTIGASGAATPAAFSDIVARAVLVIKGGYSADQHVAVNEWARAVHGATI